MSKNEDLLDPTEIGTIKRPKTPKAKAPTTQTTFINISGIYGLLVFAVCLSIGYMAYLVIFGTDDIISKYMTIPALAFVVYFLLVKAVK